MAERDVGVFDEEIVLACNEGVFIRDFPQSAEDRAAGRVIDGMWVAGHAQREINGRWWIADEAPEEDITWRL